MVTILFYGVRHLGVNRKFENYRETSRKPDAVVAFYEAKNVLQSSVEKIHINLFSLQQFSFLLKIFVKRLDQTVNVFHLRFCRLLKEPKRPIITAGTVPEFLGKTPYRGMSSNWELAAHPGTHQIAYPRYNRVGMVCEVSVRNYFDENLITMTYFSKIMMI